MTCEVFHLFLNDVETDIISGSKGYRVSDINVVKVIVSPLSSNSVTLLLTYVWSQVHLVSSFCVLIMSLLVFFLSCFDLFIGGILFGRMSLRFRVLLFISKLLWSICNSPSGEVYFLFYFIIEIFYYSVIICLLPVFSYYKCLFRFFSYSFISVFYVVTSTYIFH